MEITVRDRQTLLDIAVQYLGSAEGVIILAERNGIDITDRLHDGQLLEYEQLDIIDAAVAREYQLKAIMPATEIGTAEQETLLLNTAQYFDGCIIKPYIWEEELTNIGAEFDSHATSVETAQRRAAAARKSAPIVVDKAAELSEALSSGSEIVSESGETLARIFTDQFNDVFA